MTALPGRARDDRGFTLVEVAIAIVLVGILSAVVVVGVGQLTTRGTTAACSASADAARAAATTHLGSTGAYPTTFTAMTTASPPTLTLPAGATIDATGRVVNLGGWTLAMAPGSAGAAPRFLCNTDAPSGYTMGTNGSLYRYVAAPGISQAAAATAAATYVVDGRTGHLATITSATEQAMVASLAGSNSVWVSGTDAAAEGVWRWSAGPDNGQQYSSGAASVSGSYVNWAGGQPDNSGGEHCMHLYGPWSSAWNDVSCTWAGNAGYVVEISI